MKRTARNLLRACLLLGLLVGVYLLAAVTGACLAVNRDFHSQAGGVPIWVYCSDIHTDIVVPAKGSFDWTSLLAYQDVQQADQSFTNLAIGWGDRRFYLETPTWADVKLSNVVGAACGMHPTAMHVAWLRGDPQLGPHCRALRLSPEQYAHLCAFLRASFSQDTSGRAIHIPAPGYGANDAFYDALGHYNLFETCNTWAGQALAAGGVRIGVWTPMTWGVLWQLGGGPEP